MAIPPFLRDAAARALGAAARPFFGGAGLVLCLHRVLPDGEPGAEIPDNRALALTRSGLRELLEAARERGLEPVSVGEVLPRLRAPKKKRFLCVTLDDGYRDNLRVALPLFREFGVPFALFAATGFLDRAAWPWWDVLERAFAGRDRVAFGWAGVRRAFPLGSAGEREKAFAEIAGLIRSCGLAEREGLLETVFGAAEIDPRPVAEELLLTWEELRELSADPLATIGAHGVGHHVGMRLGEGELEREYAGSRRALEERLGREVRFLAYPFGGANAVGEREFAAAKRCGFEAAFTTRGANLFPADAARPHALPRHLLSGNYAVRRLFAAAESGLIEARGRFRGG